VAANDEDDDDDEDTETGWTAEDEEEFRTELDKNGDGVLDKDEIYHWLVPNDYDHIVDESNHLFAEADDDKVSTSFWLVSFYSIVSNLFFQITDCVRCTVDIFSPQCIFVITRNQFKAQ